MKMEEMESADKSHLSDKDLIQLAGYHRHLNIEEPKILEVSGTEVEIVDSTQDKTTGLDAFVIKEIDFRNDNDFSIVFISNQQIMVDPSVTNTEAANGVDKSAQIKSAKVYFDHIEKEYGLGTVKSVTGNFTAGALANAIAIDHSDVRSVTLNPSMLPGGMTEPGGDYTNITNYYSKNDFLTNTEETLDFGERVPGNKYHIHNGLTSFRENYSGYVDQIDDEYMVPVGVRGEAGYGFIHVAADDHIITSLWTGVPLYGGPSTMVKINQSRLYTLANGLEGKVIRRIKLAKEYMEKSNEIVIQEQTQLDRRVAELGENFKDMFDHLAENPMLQGIADGGSKTKSTMNKILALLNVAEKKAHYLNEIILSKGKGCNEHVADMKMEGPFSTANDSLYSAQDNLDQFIRSTQSVIDRDIPNLFGGGSETYVDTVTSKLKAHYSIVHRNMSRVLEQLTYFKKQVDGAALTFGQNDKDINVSFQNKTQHDPSTGDEVCPAIISLEPLLYLNRIKVKKAQVDAANNRINTLVTRELQPLLTSVEDKLALMENALSTILHSIQSTLHTTLDDNTKEEFNSMVTDYDERVRHAVDEAVQPVRKAQAIVREFKKGVDRLISKFPEMSDYFKPFLDKAIFEPCHYSNVRLYSIACSSILDEMILLFKDITFQLSNENSVTVQSSMETAKSIKKNIKVLSEQVERGIF